MQASSFSTFSGSQSYRQLIHLTKSVFTPTSQWAESHSTHLTEETNPILSKSRPWHMDWEPAHSEPIQGVSQMSWHAMQMGSACWSSRGARGGSLSITWEVYAWEILTGWSPTFRLHLHPKECGWLFHLTTSPGMNPDVSTCIGTATIILTKIVVIAHNQCYSVLLARVRK